MRLACNSPPEGEALTSRAAEEIDGGALVVVGVKLDSRSKELLTWALVKVAQSGDRVVALHILDPNADKASLISLVKTFDSVLAAYEGFCNLKQVDLKLKVCRGSPVRKIISREAKSCGATSVIVGTSEINHTIRSRISVAKHCAKNLPKNTSVVCVDNGRIVFQREAICELKSKRRKTLTNSPSSLAVVPVKTPKIQENKSGWVILRKIFLENNSVSGTSSKKSSILRWILKIPSRQSVAAIYPDQKQIVVPYTDDKNSVTYSSNNLLEELKDCGEKYSKTCRLFSYQELMVATNNFAQETFIGKGGSSRVYRGCLKGGQELAVKVLKASEDALKHFVSEVEILTSLHHKNIISLVGFCFEEDKLLLVYNLLSRGSLEENLHGTQKSGNLFGWKERHKVALGVAEALEYIHNTDDSIIHRDVKSSNILLSDDFDPQLSDFGLATWASTSSQYIGTSDVAGTFGYLAPEYFMHGKMNEKIDVYAFGVVLLELLSGRKPIDDGQPKGHESLVMWVKHIMKEGNISELQDPDLADSYDHDQFEIMVLAATLCIRYTPQSRPEISLVLKLLQGDPEVIDWARQEINSSQESNCITGEQSKENIQNFINLALLNLEDDCASISSIEQNISVEDYLGGRWSRSSSFT